MVSILQNSLVLQELLLFFDASILKYNWRFRLNQRHFMNIEYKTKMLQLCARKLHCTRYSNGIRLTNEWSPFLFSIFFFIISIANDSMHNFFFWVTRMDVNMQFFVVVFLFHLFEELMREPCSVVFPFTINIIRNVLKNAHT